MLRRQFGTEVNRRLDRFLANLHHKLVYRDSLGLVRNDWQHLTPAEQVEQFQLWVQAEVGNHLLSNDGSEQSWVSKYIEPAYKKGVTRSYEEVKKPSLAKDQAFYAGGKSQFLQTAIGAKGGRDRSNTLSAKAHGSIRSVSDATAHAASQVVAQGLLTGQTPEQIYSQIASQVNTKAKPQAQLKARDAIIGAHAEGQLDALELLGVEQVGVAVSWTTSGLGTTPKGNASPCSKCEALRNVVLTIAEARGLIPRHPGCLCSYTVAGLTPERTDQQVRTRSRILKAIKRSVGSEPKSRWIGSKLAIAKRRPKVLK